MKKLLMSVALGCLLSQSANATLEFGFSKTVQGHQVTGTFNGIMNGAGQIINISNYQVAIDGIQFQSDLDPGPEVGLLYDSQAHQWAPITTLNIHDAYTNIAFTDGSDANPYAAWQSFVVASGFAPGLDSLEALNTVGDTQYYTENVDKSAGDLHFQLLGGTQQFAFSDLIDGQTIDGTFTAAFDGNRVTQFTDMAINVNGVAQTDTDGGFSAWGYDPDQHAFVQGAEYAYLDGSIAPNFIMSAAADAYGETGLVTYYHTPFTYAIQYPGYANGAAPGIGNFHLSVVGFPDAQAGAVPEPVSWAMFIGGVGLVGCTMRGRRRIAAAFA